MTAETAGFAQFIAQTDMVGKALFVLLLLMSAVSWWLIVTKSIAHWQRARRSRRFMRLFWNAASLDEVANEISTHGATEPFAHLASHAIFARAHHARHGAARLAETGSAADFLTRTMKTVLDEETARAESGLTVLASIGATAPFVGLFGTVWGIYHALIGISVAGAGTLDKVAGPVGEALIMTGLGLAVAIPAVLGFNLFTRSNRILLARLDAFAYELFTFLSTGEQLQTVGNVRAMAQAHPRCTRDLAEVG
ncbi:MAG: MotA/TolQ/ExbB proton channel family protein [Burkholderiaceae bacterium]